MLTRITIRGYKTLRDLTLTLSPVTVLLGANNVGKTNIVRALETIANTARKGDLEKVLNEQGGRAAVASLKGDGVITFEVEGRVGGNTFTWTFGTNQVDHLTVSGPDACNYERGTKGAYFASWKNGSSWSSARIGAGMLEYGHDAEAPPIIQRITTFLAGMRAADFAPSHLRQPSTPDGGVELSREGDNLAAVLDRLHGERPGVRRRIDEEVRRAVPGIEQVVTIAQAQGQKTVGVAEGDTVFKAEHISDGILLFVGLSTIVQMSGGSTLVAIEELERGIHPRRIRETLDQLYRMARDGSQFLLTTHSPVLLNEFRDSPEAVVILERDAAGWTVARPLIGIPDLEQALQNVSLGELWYSGVLGGVPLP